MSVALGIQWSNADYEVGNSISQARAARVAAWAEQNHFPLLRDISANTLPRFTPATLGELIAEFEQLRMWWDAEDLDKPNPADVFLPRLRQLQSETGWTEGDFG